MKGNKKRNYSKERSKKSAYHSNKKRGYTNDRKRSKKYRQYKKVLNGGTKGSMKKVNTKKTNITLKDYDDIQGELLKKEESILRKEKRKKQKKAATKIQSATRARQSRKQTEWKN